MNILTELETGKRYRACSYPVSNCMFSLKEIHEKKIFDWSGVADGVFIRVNPTDVILMNDGYRLKTHGLVLDTKGWQYWDGGEWPLPACVKFDTKYQNGVIVAFRVIGLMDRWGYEKD